VTVIEKPGLQYYQDAYSFELQEKLREQGVMDSAKRDRSAYVAGLKSIFQEGREGIKRIHLSGAAGTEVVYRMTAWTDVLLRELFDSAKKLSGIKDARCSLLAIGGYGRGELNPFSDLDVMFLTVKEPDPFGRTLSENCLYLMWDLKLDIGHSMRSIQDCVTSAASDIRAKTSLIESRFIAGNPDIYGLFLKESRGKILNRDSEAYLRTKLSDVNERCKKYGGSLYMKEPHIKEGVGGLRDIHTAFWIARVKYGVGSFSELKEKRVISEREERILHHSLEFLWKVRNHLHFISGRRNDLLTMDMQEEMAPFFRYKDFKHYLAVERFMRAYYLQTRNIRYFTSLLMNRCASSRKRKMFPGISFRKKEIAEGVTLVGNTLCVPDGRQDDFRREPERLMRIFSLSQRFGVLPADATQQMILSSLSLVNHDFRSSAPVRDLFLKILRGEQRVVSTLRQMHELRFLGRYIPEFGALTALVQHDLYHTYTVDEHTLFAMEKLEGLRGSPYPGNRFYSRLFMEVRKPEILYLSLLLHDIGKAVGPGHVRKGSQAIPAVARRMGLSEEDAGAIEFMVRNHLLLGHLSQRRDIHDPKLIGRLSRLVGDQEHLRMLTLVTYCDTSAVGPGVWNDWKDTLLQELFQRTREQLLSGAERAMEVGAVSSLEKIKSRIREEGKAIFGEEIEHILATLPDRYFLSTPHFRVMKHLSMLRRMEDDGFIAEWTHYASRGYTELNVCTYDTDTPGLFSRIAGVLASRGLNILGASIFTSREGRVIDSIQVELPEEHKRMDHDFWEEIARTMRSVAQRTSQVHEILAAHQPPWYLRKKKKHKITPRVLFDNTVSDKYTVIDVYAEDRIGLLYQITSCLADQGVYIHSSKITTEADKAIDAFYVTDVFGQKILDPKKLQQIQETLLKTMSPDPSRRESA